jgi:hypothetical protein
MTITTTPQAAHTTRGHQAVRIPAVGAAGICLAFAGLQVTLAAGAPFGVPMGERHTCRRGPSESIDGVAIRPVERSQR